MRCRACGFSLSPEQLYCQNCGARTLVAADMADDLPAATGAPGGGRHGYDPNLDPEITLWQGTFSWKGMLREFLLAVGGSVALLIVSAKANDPQLRQLVWPLLAVVWTGSLVWLGFRKLDIGYQLTNQRLIHSKGILYRRTQRIEVIDIDDLSLEQGILERFVNVGRIVIQASDISDRRLVLQGIDRPREVYERIEKARRDERRKYGLHLETI